MMSAGRVSAGRRPRRLSPRGASSLKPRERIFRILSATLLAVVLLAAGLESVSHVHSDGVTHGPVAASRNVPVSIILGPDAPSAQRHWHAGSTFAPELCAACILLAQAGCVAAAVAQEAVEPAIRLCVDPATRPFRMLSAGIDSRAPPLLA